MMRITLREDVRFNEANEWLLYNHDLEHINDYEWVNHYRQFIIQDDYIALIFKLKFGL